jgi:hypothetical protein
LPDLHIKSDAFCRAQDLLIQYDDEPALVRPAELAEMVRELLTEPHWNCAADPSIVPHAHPVAQSHPATRSGQARRRRTGWGRLDVMTRLIHSFGKPPMTVRAGNFHRTGEGAPSALSLGYVAVDRSGSGVMTGRGP